jgi:hypothetical protein
VDDPAPTEKLAFIEAPSQLSGYLLIHHAATAESNASRAGLR